MASTNSHQQLKSLLKTHKLVAVTWRDSTSYNGWRAPSSVEELKCSQQVSVGWLLFKDKETIKIALSLGEDIAGDVFLIPRGCVLDIVEVKV